MGSDAEYILGSLRREYENLSNDVFSLRNDVYFLSKRLGEEISFNDKLIELFHATCVDETSRDIVNSLISELRNARGA